MKKFLKWFLIVIVFLLAVFVIGGFFIPSKWAVVETTTIAAPKEAIYHQVANLKNWQNWSPWTKEMDPTQVYTYEGPEEGEGAKWLWTSEKMGKGHLLVTSANPDKGIDYNLFMDMNGSESTIHGAILYTTEGDVQKVVWMDEGDVGNNFAKRWLTLCIKFMLGKEMRTGLSKLKALTEAQK